MDWAQTTARWDKKHLSFGIWCVIYQRIYGMFAFSIIYQHWNGTGSWNPSLWKTRTHTNYIISTILPESGFYFQSAFMSALLYFIVTTVILSTPGVLRTLETVLIIVTQLLSVSSRIKSVCRRNSAAETSCLYHTTLIELLKLNSSVSRETRLLMSSMHCTDCQWKDDCWKISREWAMALNSSAPGTSGCYCKNASFNLVSLISIFRSSRKNAIRWMPQNCTDGKSTLVQVMAWCHQATSHYLSWCWPRYMSPYGVNRLQWFNHLCKKHFLAFNFCPVYFTIIFFRLWFNSLLPTDIIWHEASWSTLVQVMAYHMLKYETITSTIAELSTFRLWKLTWNTKFSSKKMHSIMSAKYWPFSFCPQCVKTWTTLLVTMYNVIEMSIYDSKENLTFWIYILVSSLKTGQSCCAMFPRSWEYLVSSSRCPTAPPGGVRTAPLAGTAVPQ